MAAVVGLLLLSGCVRIDGDLTVHGTASDEPDTISGTVVVAVSDEWAITHGEDPTNLADAITEELAAAPDGGVTGEPYFADGYTGVTLTLEEVPIERIGASTDGALSVTREGDTYVVRGDLSILNPEEDDDAADVPWVARLSVTLPEGVSEHNGDLEGSTVTWDLDESSADPTMLAVSSVGPRSWLSRIPVPLVLLTLLAGLGAGLAWWLSRRQRDRDEDDGGFRARQASSRGASTTKLDDMLATAKQEAKGRKVSPATRPGPKPRGPRKSR